MITVEEIAQMREIAQTTRAKGELIALVPTMGFFHEGHLSLIRKARKLGDLVVVSSFVNPSQFGPGEDYTGYPREPERDRILAAENGTDILFSPLVEEMYPPGYSTWVDVEGLTEVLCGRSRPGHFRGVTTVVTKLFHIVQPHYAIFGQKDYQQAQVTKRMVKDLNFDLRVLVQPIVREPDGLAMSSRNLYLSPSQRKEATTLYRSLLQAKELVEKGERDAERISAVIREMLVKIPRAEIDYISIVDGENLRPLARLRGKVLIALAVRIGKARLIDNILTSIDE